LLIEGRLTGPGAVLVDDSEIVDVIAGARLPSGDHVALSSGVLTPGLVVLQNNGSYGVDFASATEEEWMAVARALPATGVTAFQPTFITAPLDHLQASLRRMRALAPRMAALDDAARVLGVHLEGPFLSRRQAGVHDVEFMHNPTPSAVDAILREADALLTMVTLAPELPGALDAVRQFTAAGVLVSLGHSDGTAADVAAAVDAGARMVTHVFNAQRALAHREPGVAGQALADPRLTVGLIADLLHVAEQVCLITMRAASGRVALVTDAVAAAGMPPGTYELGGQRVEVSAGDRLPRRADGTIAGSALFLDRAVRNLIGLGLDPGAVLDAATRVPADVLGRRDLGRLAPGACADLVWWSEDFRPRRTWIAGRPAYSESSTSTAASALTRAAP
jgi:N-acetylglucosamine-6-phosphate deacetylase